MTIVVAAGMMAFVSVMWWEWYRTVRRWRSIQEGIRRGVEASERVPVETEEETPGATVQAVDVGQWRIYEHAATVFYTRVRN